MKVKFSFFKYLLCFIILISMLGCSRIKNTFSSMYVTCTSYDGGMKVYVGADGKSKEKIFAGLIFSGPGGYEFSTLDSSENTEYIDSDVYENAEAIVNDRKGVRFTLMPDKLHGLVEIWKNREGDVIPMIRVPVICFKAFSHLK